MTVQTTLVRCNIELTESNDNVHTMHGPVRNANGP